MTSYKVGGIGNAIVDVLSEAEDNVSRPHGHREGHHATRRAKARRDALWRDDGAGRGGRRVGREQPWRGSATSGLSTAFIGRVRDDALGRFYASEMERIGCAFVNPPVEGGELPTSRSMIFVSPDGERSMNTYLGISAELGPEDVADEVAGACEFLFLEGYLYDKPKGKAAFERASKLCREAGGRAGIALSDPFCATRVTGPISSVSCANSTSSSATSTNGRRSTTPTTSARPSSGRRRSADSSSAPVRGPMSCLSRATWRRWWPVERIIPVDATGAGDQFAAGFLYGLGHRPRPRDLRANGLCRGVRGDLAHGAAARVVATLWGLFGGRRARLTPAGAGRRRHPRGARGPCDWQVSDRSGLSAGRALGRVRSRRLPEKGWPAMIRARQVHGRRNFAPEPVLAGRVHDDAPCRGLFGRHGQRARTFSRRARSSASGAVSSAVPSEHTDGHEPPPWPRPTETMRGSPSLHRGRSARPTSRNRPCTTGSDCPTGGRAPNRPSRGPAGPSGRGRRRRRPTGRRPHSAAAPRSGTA